MPCQSVHFFAHSAHWLIKKKDPSTASLSVLVHTCTLRHGRINMIHHQIYLISRRGGIKTDTADLLDTHLKPMDLLKIRNQNLRFYRYAKRNIIQQMNAEFHLCF